jgi:hypothetical protein
MKIRKLNELFRVGFSSAVFLLSDKPQFNKATFLQQATEWESCLEREGLIVSARLIRSKLFVAIKQISDEPTEQDFQNLTSIAGQIVDTMMAELEDVPVFSVSDKKYSFEKLFSKVDTLFRADTFEKLSEIAQYDFQESGKSIVFERSTAAAFHALRGTEAVLKQYCTNKFSNAPAENVTWYDMESDLKKLQPPVDSAVIEQLAHIRKRYRNQTQHPRLRYDIEEAQDLFNICIELVNNLSKDF